MLVRGYVLNSRYRIERTLGQGGMGAVYLATHIELGRMLAVKELRPGQDGVSPSVDSGTGPRFPPEVIQQFRVEAQLLHDLRHPNLPRVYDFFEADACHYLVMDYVRGLTLQEVLRREGPLDEARVLRWTEQICTVLDYLHGQVPPVIFRDLKPSNVIVTDGDQIKLIDFGIAKVFDRDAGEGGGTCTAARGMVSRGYSAPEQYAGGTDARSDVYSLGATLYALLTGKIPPESVDVAIGVSTIPPVRVLRPQVSECTATAIAAMMHVHRGRRPSTVEEAAALLGLTLERIETGPPSGSRPATLRSPDRMVSDTEARRAFQGRTGGGGALPGAERGSLRERPTGRGEPAGLARLDSVRSGPLRPLRRPVGESATHAWALGAGPATGHPLACRTASTASRPEPRRRPTATLFLVLGLAMLLLVAWWKAFPGADTKASAPARSSSPSASSPRVVVQSSASPVAKASPQPVAVAVPSPPVPSPAVASSPSRLPAAVTPPPPSPSVAVVHARVTPSPVVAVANPRPVPVRTVAPPRPTPQPLRTVAATRTPVPMRTIDVEPRAPGGPVLRSPGETDLPLPRTTRQPGRGFGRPVRAIVPGRRIWMVDLGTRVPADIAPRLREVMAGDTRALVVPGAPIALTVTTDWIVTQVMVAPFWGFPATAFATPGGTGIGAEEAAVIREFGEPTSKAPQGAGMEWSYPRQGIRFWIRGGRVRAIIVYPVQD